MPTYTTNLDVHSRGDLPARIKPFSQSGMMNIGVEACATMLSKPVTVACISIFLLQYLLLADPPGTQPVHRRATENHGGL